jgi:D-sedoheptulose 7-phosphate isomerase
MTPTDAHLDALRRALDDFQPAAADLDRWGSALAACLTGGGRLLTVGNGGSAAHAEHLASEIVGRYFKDRPPFSAIALHVDGSAITALVNDYGVEEMFTRQVCAHGRSGDVLVAFSTSGRSPNVVAAARAAIARGMVVWSFTGPAPNPLAEVSTDVVVVPTDRTATVQEVHQVALHLLCAAFDRALDEGASAVSRPAETTTPPPTAGSTARRSALVPDFLVSNDEATSGA